ncbi:hypothetical protein V1227_32765 [Lentzea sp. DG1S-22]|uniref:hypothetical protein n=1 Tax=Lentzea sp. DG1S-22 TaxID=3108822 RepID=UPI002E7A7C73|nr:hypothetical protein [Lentzea sp. DG1S-22]WVH79755.1 hypothetical protein V1227_32765 [Lentzea sp. DG1S-22]
MNEFGLATEWHEIWHENVAVPLVDGTPLTEWVDIFETVRDMRPAGGMYGGLTAVDRGDKPFQPGKSQLVLGCSCGHADCWPLYARIIAHGDMVVWDEFRQPRRRERDYIGFGPYRFDRARYEAVVAELG